LESNTIRSSRKTREYGPSFLGPNLKKAIFGTQAMETAAPWKPWKTNCMFSTVPTALGKLGKKHGAEFPTVPTASTAGYLFRGKKKQRLSKS